MHLEVRTLKHDRKQIALKCQIKVLLRKAGHVDRDRARSIVSPADTFGPRGPLSFRLTGNFALSF